MRFLKHTAVAALLVLLATNTGRAGDKGFVRQWITLPPNVSAARFVDTGNDGRAELLAVDRVQNRLLIYRQGASGFSNAPDQTLTLPPRTAWIAPCDVDAHPGSELLLSTASGLVYFRQAGGVFETEPRSLVQAEQVFGGDDSPALISLATNADLPVISAAQAVLYRRNDGFEWSRGQPIALEAKRTKWGTDPDAWTLGANPSSSLFIRQFMRSSASDVDDEKPENDAVRKIIDDMKKASPLRLPGWTRVDLDGDGRKDLVLWQFVGEMDFRTDVYVFLRGADGRLPERPTQILHCHGLPIPIGSTLVASPVGDLNGDGRYELVLLELKSSFTSASSLLEMAMSRGLDWGLTVRPFDHGAFARSPNVAITTIVPLEASGEWPLFVCGDFNGDGRLDFLLRHATDRWDIYFNTADGTFASQPAISFETPMAGHFEIEDLNGDGLSDIVLRAAGDPRIFIYLSQSSPTKGRRP